MNMYEELESIIKSMNDTELADYILAFTCKELEGKETDVFYLANQCTEFLNGIRVFAKESPERVFNVLEIIISQLKEVSGGGGLLTIEKLN